MNRWRIILAGLAGDAANNLAMLVTFRFLGFESGLLLDPRCRAGSSSRSGLGSSRSHGWWPPRCRSSGGSSHSLSSTPGSTRSWRRTGLEASGLAPGDSAGSSSGRWLLAREPWRSWQCGSGGVSRRYRGSVTLRTKQEKPSPNDALGLGF